MITSNTIYTEDELSLLDILTKDRRRCVGLVQPSMVQEIALGISGKVTRVYQDIFHNEDREIKKSLKTLGNILESYEMPELANALKN